jgi:hypothetical protein
MVRSTVTELTPRRTAIACLVMIGFLAATWRTIVIGMWPTLAGRKWLSMTIGVATFGQLTVAVLAGGWIYRHPEVQSRLLSAVPWLLGCVLMLKLCGVAGALAALRKLGQLDTRTTVIVLGGWLAVAAAVFAALSYFAPVTWQLVAGVMLFLPLVRILVAPLALYLNRHR